MNRLGGAIIFVCGAITGAIGTLFYLRKEFEKKVDEEVKARDMAIRELKRQNSEKDQTISEQRRKFNEDAVEALVRASEYVSDQEYPDTDKSENALREASRGLKTSSGIRKGVIYSIDENGEINDHPTEGISDRPYSISVEDFLMSHKEFDKTTLMFYEGDEVLSTENGDVVEDINYILGNDWTKYVGKYEDNIAYIRNEKISTDYEVICEKGQYKDEWQ